MNLFRILLLAGAAALGFTFVQTAQAAEVEARALDYKQGDTALQGWLATPKGVSGKVPAVLVIHDWSGVTRYSRERAEQLAGLGYVALVADIYGKDSQPKSPDENSKMAGKFKNDRALFRQRLLAGLEALKAQPNVDAANIAAIGYCFGGTGVLELARAGADVKGVVSFHGGLDSPSPGDGKNIKARVLVLHGADDPFVPKEGIEAMVKEFTDAGVDWQLIAYGGAVHSFSNKYAGTDKSKGNAYDPSADRRSWAHMLQFFGELFGEKKP